MDVDLVGAREPAGVAESEDQARLVRAIAGGDRSAEDVFVLRYSARVRAMVRMRTRNADAAEDLAQDVLIGAICALRKGQLREPERLTFFVLGVARNHINEFFRGSARTPVPLEFPEQIPDLGAERDRAESSQREELALRAMEHLDPIDKAILQMTLVEGMKPGRIAERLQLSSDVVRQRKVRATRRVIDFVARQSQNPVGSYSTGEKKR